MHLFLKALDKFVRESSVDLVERFLGLGLRGFWSGFDLGFPSLLRVSHEDSSSVSLVSLLEHVFLCEKHGPSQEELQRALPIKKKRRKRLPFLGAPPPCGHILPKRPRFWKVLRKPHNMLT